MRIRRKGDMDPHTSLSIRIEEDQDVVISIGTGRGVPIHDENGPASVEFCIPHPGGGKSPRTYAALRELAKAIAEDNAAFPRLNPDVQS